MPIQHESRKYLGLELAGAKNQKTAIAVLEYFPKQNKTFLLDIYDRLPSGDIALLDLLNDLQHEEKSSQAHHGMHGASNLTNKKLTHFSKVAKMGVNVPLELPPCLTCNKKTCNKPGECNSPAVKWMREFTQKISRNSDIRVNEFTSYTQRPVELWVRYDVLQHLPPSHRFEIDEALGGNKAPLTARMQYLKRFLGDLELSEVWPKLSIAVLAKQMGLSKRLITRYRQLEEGVHAREEILENLIEDFRIFIYERDIRKISHSLAAFDAFICAYTALLADLDQCAEIPKGFPVASGWVQYPSLDADAFRSDLRPSPEQP